MAELDPKDRGGNNADVAVALIKYGALVVIALVIAYVVMHILGTISGTLH